MQNLSYEEVAAAIENKRRFGNLKGIEISGVMLEKLNHPERAFRLMHIAGTNGKGSVSAFLREILRAAGEKVGLFTSPHLVDFRERIQADGEMIPRADAARIGNALLSEDFGVSPTMFDYCLVMALLYFKEKKCSVVILETGLGGRSDSTNACGVPDVTVITKIGFDHMAVLGDTLGKIAWEKAGIIKRGTRLVLESQQKEAMDVLRAEAEAAGVTDVRVVDMEKLKILPMREKRQRFSYGEFEDLTMKQLGVYQYENAAAAILAAEAFFGRRVGRAAADAAIRCGIADTVWEGRMELISERPFFLMDGAHNENGAKALAESLRALFPDEKFHFVMGVMADKDYMEMIRILLPLALDFKTVTVAGGRALPGEELAGKIRACGAPATACGSVREALAKLDGKTVAFGSLYFIGEIKALRHFLA